MLDPMAQMKLEKRAHLNWQESTTDSREKAVCILDCFLLQLLNQAGLVTVLHFTFLTCLGALLLPFVFAHLTACKVDPDKGRQLRTRYIRTQKARSMPCRYCL